MQTFRRSRNDAVATCGAPTVGTPIFDASSRSPCRSCASCDRESAPIAKFSTQLKSRGRDLRRSYSRHTQLRGDRVGTIRCRDTDTNSILKHRLTEQIMLIAAHDLDINELPHPQLRFQAV